MWLAIFIVAEGIEQHEQVAYLRKLGCHEFQGYLLAHPMSASDFEAWHAERGINAVHALGSTLQERLKLTA